jgi:hypothetical protein
MVMRTWVSAEVPNAIDAPRTSVASLEGAPGSHSIKGLHIVFTSRVVLPYNGVIILHENNTTSNLFQLIPLHKGTAHSTYLLLELYG